jgi:hypothetical protein
VNRQEAKGISCYTLQNNLVSAKDYEVSLNTFINGENNEKIHYIYIVLVTFKHAFRRE